MTTDNKTLADAQPGGRVRLGDQAELDRLEFQAWARSIGARVDADEHGNYVDANLNYAKLGWNAALSAQPSPGGQDALAALQQDYDKLLDSFNRQVEVAEKIAGRALQQDDRIEELEEALAARQPVGDAITVEAVATVRRNGDGDRYIDWLTEGGIADLEVGDVLMVSDRAITDEDGSGEVYAAPPAQAVDLGAVRDVFRRWHANELNSTDAMLALVEALAVIDSQAVGNG